MQTTDSQHILQTAYTALQKQQYDQAEQLCQQALQVAPTLAKALQLRAMIAQRTGTPKIALEYCHQTLTHAPNDAEIHNLLANIETDLGETAKAHIHYQKAIALAPDYIPALQNYGYALLRTHKPQAACPVFEQGLKLSPKHALLQKGHMESLKKTGQYKRLLHDYAPLLSRKAHALTDGQVRMQIGDLEGALAAFRLALSDPPSQATAFKNLIQIQFIHNDIEAATAQITDTLARYPTPQAFQIASKAYANMGLMDAAHDVLTHALETLGAQIEIDIGRAFLYIESDPQKAYAHSEAALRHRPGDLEAMALLSCAALKSERYEQAQNTIQAAHKRLPNNPFWLAVEATHNRLTGLPYQYLYNFDDFIGIYDITPPDNYPCCAEFNTSLKTALMQYHIFHNHPIDQSLRSGIQTHANLCHVKDPSIVAFFETIALYIHRYMQHIGTADNHPFKRSNPGEFDILNAWSVAFQGQGYHVNHVHPEGWISAVYYVDVPEGLEQRADKAGWLQFGAPPYQIGGLEAEKLVAPKPGRLVLFPSYMWHGTRPLQSKGLRLTLAFDIVAV